MIPKLPSSNSYNLSRSSVKKPKKYLENKYEIERKIKIRDTFMPCKICQNNSTNDIRGILSRNPSLSDFTLSNFNMPLSTTLPPISKYLKTNSTLLELILSNSNINDQNLLQLVLPLKNHPTLKILDLNSNLLQNNGIKVISEIIQCNSIIEEIDLYNNNIGEDGALYFLLSIQNFNTTLIDVCIWGNYISKGLMEQIEYCIGWNIIRNINIAELSGWKRKGVCEEYRLHVVMLILVMKIWLRNVQNYRKSTWEVLNMLKVTDIVTNPRSVPWNKNTWKMRGDIKKIKMNGIFKDEVFGRTKSEKLMKVNDVISFYDRNPKIIELQNGIYYDDDYEMHAQKLYEENNKDVSINLF